MTDKLPKEWDLLATYLKKHCPYRNFARDLKNLENFIFYRHVENRFDLYSYFLKNLNFSENQPSFEFQHVLTMVEKVGGAKDIKDFTECFETMLLVTLKLFTNIDTMLDRLPPKLTECDLVILLNLLDLIDIVSRFKGDDTEYATDSYYPKPDYDC